jgi:hypothetical protein
MAWVGVRKVGGKLGRKVGWFECLMVPCYLMAKCYDTMEKRSMLWGESDI